MGRLKERLYDKLVRKNGRVWYEYERYVREHMEEHRFHKLRSLRVLFKLNWFYRVKKGNTPYLYWDTPLDPSANLVPLASKRKSSNKPYTAGAESRIGTYTSPADFVNKLASYDVISFDLFDTLVFRPFSSAKDLFMLVGEKLNVLDFVNIRTEAERIVRERREESAIQRDVNIYEIWKLDTEVIGMIAGTNTVYNAEPDAAEPFLQGGQMVAYLYSQAHNRDLLLKHDPNKNYNIFWELLLSSPTPKFEGFYPGDTDSDVVLKFGDYDANQKGIIEIQNGILDFVKDYIAHFKDFPYMFNISGRDAYAPMLLASSHKERYLKAIENRYKFAINVD